MPVPTPRPNEDEADFVRRAHESLVDEFPDAEKRNAVIFDAWRNARGESGAEKRAYEKFSDDDFAHLRFVPVFKEHEYPRVARERDGRMQLDDDGNPVYDVEKYDFEALRAICNNMNHRIADTGDFAPITDKHTPHKGSEESKPKLLGFSGPFHLGQIGNVNRRWAILAQEHWFKDKSHLARELPRRSAEVYLGRPMHERVLDPITALGAETPALDMGIHYSQHDGELVARYSGPPLLAHYDAMAAFPGSGNVRPPSELNRKKAAYSDAPAANKEAAPPTPTEASGSTDPNETTENEPMAISPEDANMIIAALLETPPLKWVAEQMAAQSAEGAPGTDTDAAGMGADDSAMGGAGAPPAGDPPGMGGPPAMGGDQDADNAPGAPPSANDGDADDTEKYSLRTQLRGERARYAALEQRVAANERELKKARDTAELEYRAGEIHKFYYQGYPIDVQDEIQQCSLETYPTRGAFQRHMEDIARYSKPNQIPVGVSLYAPELPKSLAPGAKSEDAIASSPQFIEEVEKACYSRQCQPDYVHDPDLFRKVRAELLEKKTGKAGSVTKVV